MNDNKNDNIEIEKPVVKKYVKIFSRKRKSAVCRLRLINDTKFIVNDIPLEKYFDNITYLITPIIGVLKLFSLDRGIGFSCRVNGGGKSAQSGSIVCSLANAVKDKFKSEFASDEGKFKLYNSILRKEKLLTVDTRKVEPKKYGLKKARKMRQRSKR